MFGDLFNELELQDKRMDFKNIEASKEGDQKKQPEKDKEEKKWFLSIAFLPFSDSLIPQAPFAIAFFQKIVIN